MGHVFFLPFFFHSVGVWEYGFKPRNMMILIDAGEENFQNREFTLRDVYGKYEKKLMEWRNFSCGITL